MKIFNLFLEKVFLFFRIIKFRRKIRFIKKKDKKLFEKVGKEVERQHVKLWKNLSPSVDTSWLRFYSKVSGVVDYRYVPEDLYYAIIERRLNDINYSHRVADKCCYDELLKDCDYLPHNFLKNISGSYISSRKKIVTFSEAENIFESLKEDVIVKPSIESGGGKNILYLKYKKGVFLDFKGNKYSLEKIQNNYRKNFVIQKLVVQLPFFAQFNETSLNTLRVFVYRSVLDEKIKILNIVLRMGRKGMYVDNQMSGGISVGVDIKTGKLNDFAISKYGEKFYKHPDSKITFKGKVIMNINDVSTFVKKLASQIPSHRLLSLDVCIDKGGNVRIIEINTTGVEINFLQLSCGSLFSNFTEEIISFCKSKKSDDFEYFKITK